jgi:Zn-dependent peptidase ImmA (M78 family)/transcriptional regulator with XRE-family HTH domain
MNAIQHNLPARLTEVRSLASLSQAELAKKVGVSSSLISHWEKGTRVPSQAQLLELARNLGVALDYLLSSVVRPQFRFRAKASPHPEQTPAIERTLLDASQQVHFVDTALRLAGKAPTPFSLLAQFTSFKELPNITSHLRETLKLNRRVTLGELKQALSEWNVFVFEWNMPWHLSGLSFRGPFTVIFINHEHPRTRRLFTLTHEFAHVLFHLGRKTGEPSAPDADDTVVSIASHRDPLEKQANAFAGEFLMPTSELLQLVDDYGSRIREPAHLEAEARSFNVSRDALFYRLTKLGVFDWTEKSRYFPGGFETPALPEHRVEEIEPQVDPAFRHLAISLLQADKITTGKLAQWFFAQRHIVDNYLAKLAAETDIAISNDNNHDEEPLPAK